MGAGRAEFYNPAGAVRAGEMGGAAVVALGGRWIRLSCCCNKSLLFAKSVLCVCASPPRERRLGLQVATGRNRPPARGRGQEPGGAARRRAQREGMRCRRCSFDAARGPRRLMRMGLALILVGHLNLLLGAVLHGTVLRHVANPRGAVTSEYTTANVISVGSGLLVSCGCGAARCRGRGGAARASGFVFSRVLPWGLWPSWHPGTSFAHNCTGPCWH